MVPVERCTNRVFQKAQDRLPLRPQALADCEHSLDETRTRRACRAERPLRQRTVLLDVMLSEARSEKGC